MDVGADEFEQSLPLLQELVLGADFVGKAPRFQALWPEPLAGGSCGGCGAGRTGGGEAQPACGRLGEGAPKDRESPSLPGQWDVKQQLSPGLCCGPGDAEPTDRGSLGCPCFGSLRFPFLISPGRLSTKAVSWASLPPAASQREERCQWSASVHSCLFCLPRRSGHRVHRPSFQRVPAGTDQVKLKLPHS